MDKLFQNKTGVIVLSIFLIALAIFLWALGDFIGKLKPPEIASDTSPTQTSFAPSPTASPPATIAPTATPTALPATSIPTRTAPTATPIVPPTATLVPTTAPTSAPTVSTLPRQTYGKLPMEVPPTDRPASASADMNLTLRGYVTGKGATQLMDVEGATDGLAPQLSGLFTDHRAPNFKATFQVNDWDWQCNCKAKPFQDPDVTLATFSAAAGEAVRTPHAGYDIGDGYQAIVLYADVDEITLVYTRNDTVAKGYVVHIQNIAVAPELLALYQQLNSAGRSSLPALKTTQPFGQAQGDLRVAVRDSGSFMDPRSRKDWWRDMPIPITKPKPDGPRR